jgi:hypothetical protein
MCEKMKSYGKKAKEKLYEIGNSIGLDASDISNAKRTAKTIVTICIIAGIIALIGIFSKRLEAVGQWYGTASIKDFQLLTRFF